MTYCKDHLKEVRIRYYIPILAALAVVSPFVVRRWYRGDIWGAFMLTSGSILLALLAGYFIFEEIFHDVI